MELEVGKFYKVRDDQYVTKVRIDCIRPESGMVGNQVAATRFFSDGSLAHIGYDINGFCMGEDRPMDIDLVAEYEEPKLVFTEEDVGTRVRRACGKVSLIVGFNPKLRYAVETSDGFYDINGLNMSGYNLKEKLK